MISLGMLRRPISLWSARRHLRNCLPRELIARFDADIPPFYPEDVRARGYLEVSDRRGAMFRAPLVSLAVAIVTNEQLDLRHPGQVAERAAEVKETGQERAWQPIRI